MINFIFPSLIINFTFLNLILFLAFASAGGVRGRFRGSLPALQRSLVHHAATIASEDPPGERARQWDRRETIPEDYPRQKASD